MASGSGSLYKGSDEICSCDVCLSTGEIPEAISYCDICCEYLCQSCDVAHRGSRATKDHQLLTGSNMPSVSTRTQPTSPFMFCFTHKTSFLNTYCTTHDEVICSACKMSNHSTCKTGDVSRHSAKTDVGKELKKVAYLLRDLTNKYDNLRKNRLTDKSTVMSQIHNCLSELKQFRKDIIDNLNMLEQKMSSDIQQIEETVKNEIDGHVRIAGEIIDQIGDLHKSLSKCEKTREDDVIFVASKKAFSRASEYCQEWHQIKKQIYPVDIRFQRNGVLSDIIQQLQSLGTVAQYRPIISFPKQTSILNISVKVKLSIHITSNAIRGCAFISDGHLVLACLNDGLKLLDTNFLFTTKLSEYSGDVSAINDTDVIVKQGQIKQLKRVRIFPRMEVKKTLKMDRYCYGVDGYGDELYVTCQDDSGNGEVRVLNMNGELQRRLGKVNGKSIFIRPKRVRVNMDGSKIFVVDEETDTVTCLTSHGQVIYRYSDKYLISPAGIYVDEEDNVLVCGLNSSNVHMVRHDGKQERILLSEKDGIHLPMCISFRPSDGCLVVGLHNNARTDKKLIIFSTR